MNTVGIAEFKAKLSEYLRSVRRGNPLTVLDRKQPVAVVSPVTDDSAFRSREPLPGAPRLQDVELPPRPDLDPDFDVVDLLLEERLLDR